MDRNVSSSSENNDRPKINSENSSEGSSEADTYVVSRSYTEVCHVAVTDEVRVKAESPEEAQKKVRDQKHEEVVGGSESTGHQEWTGEIVSTQVDEDISVGEVELIERDMEAE